LLAPDFDFAAEPRDLLADLADEDLLVDFAGDDLLVDFDGDDLLAALVEPDLFAAFVEPDLLAVFAEPRVVPACDFDPPDERVRPALPPDLLGAPPAAERDLPSVEREPPVPDADRPLPLFERVPDDVDLARVPPDVDFPRAPADVERPCVFFDWASSESADRRFDVLRRLVAVCAISPT